MSSMENEASCRIERCNQLHSQIPEKTKETKNVTLSVIYKLTKLGKHGHQGWAEFAQVELSKFARYILL